jgi:serine protease Do
MNKSRLRCALPSLLPLLLLAAAGTGVFAQSPLDGVFDKAIEYARKRVVKVYGATAGRVDGYASGVIVSPDGLIITMQGVYLDGSNTRVTLPDGRQCDATILKRNRELQLALLKIAEPTSDYFELTTETVGAKGDWVITLSNAFKVADGVEPLSVNLGIISLETTIDARLGSRDVAYRGPLVLVDAITSNPGAGGGAVVLENGQLVGAIGRVINSTDTNTRLNYAVPAFVLREFLEDKLTENPVEFNAGRQPGELGIQLFRTGGSRSPAYIDRVDKGSVADAAGFRPDDLVISIGGTKIGSIREYDEALKSVYAGDEVIIVVKRGESVLRVPVVPPAKER